MTSTTLQLCTTSNTLTVYRLAAAAAVAMAAALAAAVAAAAAATIGEPAQHEVTMKVSQCSEQKETNNCNTQAHLTCHVQIGQGSEQARAD
jgi:lipopolysaccharide export system protein LptA